MTKLNGILGKRVLGQLQWGCQEGPLGGGDLLEMVSVWRPGGEAPGQGDSKGTVEVTHLQCPTWCLGGRCSAGGVVCREEFGEGWGLVWAGHQTESFVAHLLWPGTLSRWSQWHLHLVAPYRE